MRVLPRRKRNRREDIAFDEASLTSSDDVSEDATEFDPTEFGNFSFDFGAHDQNNGNGNGEPDSIPEAETEPISQPEAPMNSSAFPSSDYQHCRCPEIPDRPHRLHQGSSKKRTRRKLSRASKTCVNWSTQPWILATAPRRLISSSIMLP